MKMRLPIILDWIILAIFTIWFLIIGNYEFLVYTVTIGVLIFLINWSDKKFNYSNIAMYGFSIWLFLHFSGGAFKPAGTRLYDTILLNIIGEPYFILRYDQLIHAICYFVITLFVYAIIMSMANKKSRKFLIGLVVLLSALGIGAINEIIEFGTVIFLDAAEAVGDYTNTALDLVFNFIGALVAIGISRKFK